MGTRSPEPGGSSHQSAFQRILGAGLTAGVLAGLCGAAYWGHVTGWEFKATRAQTGGAPVSLDAQRPVVRVLTATPQAGTAPPLPGQRIYVEFASAGEVNRAGIDVTPAWCTPLTEQAAAAGEVRFDPSRVARLSPRAGGICRRVMKAVGDPVREGEVLALIESTEVGKVKAEFQQALVQTRLKKRTRDDLVSARSATSPAAIRESEAAVNDAEVRLLAAVQSLANYGLPVQPDEYRTLPPAEVVQRMRRLGVEDVPPGPDDAGATSNLLPVRAPMAGVVLKTDVVSGEVVEAGKVVFTVVDPSRVWITLNLDPEHARRAAAGQKVFFRPDSGTREHPAVVVWVGTAADETTRTVPVRAEAENAAGTLRASTLGRGRVVLREEAKALVVPHEAVRPFQGRSVVFVRHPEFLAAGGQKSFDVRVVRTGGRDERSTEILDGLAATEIVATKGSDLLLGEVMRAVDR